MWIIRQEASDLPFGERPHLRSTSLDFVRARWMPPNANHQKTRNLGEICAEIDSVVSNQQAIYLSVWIWYRHGL